MTEVARVEDSPSAPPPEASGAALLTLGGLAAAFAGTRVISSLLFNTTSTDVVTYTVAPASLAVVALLASWWPTRRAVRVDPTIAMRASD